MTLAERLTNIQKAKTEAIEKMKAMVDKADEEKRELTAEEEAEFTKMDGEVEKAKKEEERTIKMMKDEEVRDAPAKTVRTYISQNPKGKEFRNIGDWLYHVRFFPQDERLAYQDFGEERQQSMGVGVEGGFMVPAQFIPQLRMIEPAAAIFRPRCTVIPAGSPPDATATLPVLNQTAAQNIYGGMAVQWIAEAATKPETDLELLQVCLTPHEVAGHTIITDKLLRNWEAADALITRMLRLAVNGAEDTAFYNGTGVGQPLGIVTAPATVGIARAGAGAVVVADIQGMYARIKFGGSLVWIISQTVLPQLTALVDAGNHLIWMPNATGVAGSPPGTLMGIPVLINERSVALGTLGDIMLVDLSYYLIKDGSGPFVATCPHVHFTTNRTVIKIFWNVDGQPWLSGPIPLEGTPANTVSPFIVLNA
jgi:HK97 family phage major capsid protein